MPGHRHWMPLYIADYRADTAHLSAAQHGAYLLLIMHYWQAGCLPEEETQLARIACMAPAEWKRNRDVLSAFFDAGWRHHRIEAEIFKADEKYRKLSEAGSKGGRPPKPEKPGGKPFKSQAFETLKASEKPLESYLHSPVPTAHPIQEEGLSSEVVVSLSSKRGAA